MKTKFEKVFIVLFIVGFSMIFSCDNDTDVNKNDNDIVKVSLRQEWFPFSGYAGEVVAINETDSLYGLDIVLEAGSDNIDPIKLVQSGSNDFGVVSADRILTANEKGAQLVVIGVINYKSPTCFLAKKSKNINTPKDLEGKKVGILTGTNTEYVYKSLIKNAEVDEDLIEEMEIPFDLGTFITDAYDVRPAFIYDEPISLDLQGIDYSIIEPIDYNVHFLGTVYFTTKEFAEENPEIVQSFINSIADGWKIALENPEKAIKYLKDYDKNIDEERELLSLEKGLSYFKGQDSKILYARMSEWNSMAETLIELGKLQQNKIDKIVDYTFLEKYWGDDTKTGEQK